MSFKMNTKQAHKQNLLSIIKHIGIYNPSSQNQCILLKTSESDISNGRSKCFTLLNKII